MSSGGSIRTHKVRLGQMLLHLFRYFTTLDYARGNAVNSDAIFPYFLGK